MSRAGNDCLELVCQVVECGQWAEQMHVLIELLDVDLQFSLVRTDLDVLLAISDFD
jgi:hypothetical protein